MSSGILQNIITNFDLQRLKRFFSEKNSKFRPSEESFDYYNTDNFSDGLKLGELFLDDGTLLVCAFEAKQELSERSGKKGQYELGKKILKETQTDAGIFIYYDQVGNFRFSLIYANYFDKKRDWNNFRRFTYFVGNDLTNKTFKQRIGEGDFSSLEKIKDSFSVEKVTKEFYEDIANWYFWAVGHSTFPKDAEEEENGRNIAVIRLITRMIFIWFMRERKLVPKYLFDKKILNNILKDTSPESPTYYLAILQNLFFATLNTKNTKRNFHREWELNKQKNLDYEDYNGYCYCELFKDPTKIIGYFGDIPFLNGGLFECLDDKSNGVFIDGFSDNIKNQPLIPNYLFFSGEIDADLNNAYGTKNKSYKVRGLIDTLSSYNFTIDENNTDDQEVALDPELLGRVFENLLASFNPETSTTARKATGSYYTPREIVDYMVTESLKEYFKTHLSDIYDIDKKIVQLFLTGNEENPLDKSESKKMVKLIESVRIVDPAVGSGAFPMGVLNKLVFILNKVDPGNELWKQAQLSAADTIPDSRIKQDTKSRVEEFFKGKNADYGRKLYLIQKCIYGVDIQQIAVEIAKLRFFISLLVNEEIDRKKDNWGIEPLPNLDFKIMQGNSLISEFLGIDFDNDQKKQELQIQADLGLENEDDGLIKEFERKKIDYQNESGKDEKIKLKNEVEDLMIKIFESKVENQKTGYFKDIEEIERKYSILPNKRLREEIIAKEKQKLSQKTGFDLENIEKQLREFTSKKKTRPFFSWKLYFAEVFEKDGFDIVIGNPPWIQSKSFSKSDKDIFSKLFATAIGQYDLFNLFIEKSYGICKERGVVCFITPDRFITNIDYKQIRDFLLVKTALIQVIALGDGVFENVCMPSAILFFQKTISKDNKVLLSPIFYGTFYEVSQNDFMLNSGSIFPVYKDASNTSIINNINKNSVKFGEIVNNARGVEIGKKSKLISQTKRSGYEPFLRGEDIDKYIIKKQVYINLSDPNIDYKSKDLYKGKKILIRKTGLGVSAVIDEEYRFVIQVVYIFKIKQCKDYNEKFIIALLNSKLMEFWYFSTFGEKERKTFPHLTQGKILEFPIIPESLQNQQPFVRLVDNILTITKSNDYLENSVKKEEVKEYGKQIDQMVYKLYELTPEEIEIVENTCKK